MSTENQYSKLQQEHLRLKTSLVSYDRALKKSQKNEKSLIKENKKFKSEIERLKKKLRTIAQAAR